MSQVIHVSAMPHRSFSWKGMVVLQKLSASVNRGGSRIFLRGGAEGRGVNNHGLGVATKYCA